MIKLIRMCELYSKQENVTAREGYRLYLQYGEDKTQLYNYCVLDSKENTILKNVIEYLTKRGYGIQKGSPLYGKYINGVYKTNLEPVNASYIDEMPIQSIYAKIDMAEVEASKKFKNN